MLTAPDLLLAREIGASRRAAAEQSALSAVIRLANREDRLRRRLDRAHSRLSGRVAH
ncbi:MAG: hypothetical protein ACRDP1_13820 [Nocardioidaceae bacterium]